MNAVNNRKSWPLIGGLISSALCTVAGGHGFAPLLFLEIDGLSNQYNGDDAKWQSLAFLTLLGQICLVLALIIRNKTSYILFGSLGFVLLSIAVAALLYSVPASFSFSIWTSVPFMVFLLVFFVKIYETAASDKNKI